ncbi:MAG: aminoglycoside phosphotransferase family protein [Myxococcota bacterium]|nr:aminoglycoside phosphotransferase family protein [Myxococcota bacterium]
MVAPGRAEKEAVDRALLAWSALSGARLEPLEGGLINESWRAVVPGAEYVAQRVHGDFSPGIHRNMQAVSRHLNVRGVSVAQLLPTDEGALFSDLGEGGRWRVMKRLPGVTFRKCQSPAQARSAGELVAAFHGGMVDWDGPLEPIGFAFHEMDQHLDDLRRALEQRRDHPLRSGVRDLAERIFSIHATWPSRLSLPRRVLHGDLKLSNILFAGANSPERDRAQSLIDLDTISRLPLFYDMGDAWRSWCNVGGEGPEDIRLDLEIFAASAEGYLSKLNFELLGEERDSMIPALEYLSLELCARFATDALWESHFSWDPENFSTRGEHNLYRALGQISLHDQARETQQERARSLFGSSALG